MDFSEKFVDAEVLLQQYNYYFTGELHAIFFIFFSFRINNFSFFFFVNGYDIWPLSIQLGAILLYVTVIPMFAFQGLEFNVFLFFCCKL